MFKKIINYIKQNKTIVVIIAIYSLSMLSILNWGIPNPNHPYNYHMDEWHQLQSIRNLVTQGSPNVEGSANGTIFHFLLSGIYLSPLIFIKIIDISKINSLIMQERLFEILRVNTLIFGCLSILMLAALVKKFFKLNPILPLILFTVTPLWLSLSNYFKYDIALVFWIITSLFFLLKYGQKTILRNYIIAGVFCSLALATKISALPLLLIYIISFFYFNFDKKKKYRHFLAGLSIFVIIFLVFGIPDLILQTGDYGEYFYSNLVRDHAIFDNFILKYNPWWAYILLKVFPLDFGYVFFGLFSISSLYWGVRLFPKIVKLKFKTFKNEIFLFISMCVFIISLIPLELGANGNRLLVLLPFFALFSSLFLFKIIKRSFLFLIIFSILLLTQIIQSFVFVYVKWQDDPRWLASYWIIENINKETNIGVENIPIYQLLPDIIVKEFYLNKNRIYNYQIIDSKTSLLPDTIVITNKEFDLNYLQESDKKNLIKRLNVEGYKMVREFKPSKILYAIMGNEFAFYSSGIVPIPTITIYSR